MTTNAEAAAEHAAFIADQIKLKNEHILRLAHAVNILRHAVQTGMESPESDPDLVTDLLEVVAEAIDPPLEVLIGVLCGDTYRAPFIPLTAAERIAEHQGVPVASAEAEADTRAAESVAAYRLLEDRN